MRRLASVQIIKEIEEIRDADNIVLAKVMSWQAVVKKGEYKVGDKCVYFEVDSFLPLEEKYEFLRNSSYRKNIYCGEGYRIKTMKLRGCLSQGLIMPISEYPDLDVFEEGTDVTELLNVKKWEMPEVEGSIGTMIGDKPYGIPTADELRVQSNDILRQKLIGKPYYITTKMDGTSMTCYFMNGKVGVCSRNNELADTKDSSYWNLVKSYNLPEKLKKLNKNIAIQGEFCGHGIQCNRLMLTKPKLFVFDVIDLDEWKRYNYYEICDLVKELELDMVPTEEVGESFNYQVDELIEMAKGKYESGKNKEGIVIRPIYTEHCTETGTKLSFKVLNNEFLLKNEK